MTEYDAIRAAFAHNRKDAELLLHETVRGILAEATSNKVKQLEKISLCCNRSLRFYLLHICLTHRPGSILCPSVPIFRQARACLVALSPETRG